MELNIYDLDWIHHQYRFYSNDDLIEWKRIFGSEPVTGTIFDKSGSVIPCGSGPHCLKVFRLFKRTHNPTRLLEIGFNDGRSARIMLSLGVEHLTSCEIRISDQVTEDSSAVSKQFPNFRLFNGPSKEFKPEPGDTFDSAYIDGDHSLPEILNDITLCKNLGVKSFLFDDIFPIHGDALEAAKKSDLTVDWICGNMMACTNIDRNTLIHF